MKYLILPRYLTAGLLIWFLSCLQTTLGFLAGFSLIIVANIAFTLSLGGFLVYLGFDGFTNYAKIEASA